MAVVNSLNCHNPVPAFAHPQNQIHSSSFLFPAEIVSRRRLTIYRSRKVSEQNTDEVKEMDSIGVKAAISVLKFYKREISPILPRSCRYVPTCSDYSMEAYKKYGFVKGTVLTTWRLCRCNPLGGTGFDPPRWFDEKRSLEE